MFNIVQGYYVGQALGNILFWVVVVVLGVYLFEYVVVPGLLIWLVYKLVQLARKFFKQLRTR